MSKADVIYGMLVYGYGMVSMFVFDLMFFYLHLFDLSYKATLYLPYPCLCLVLIITDARHYS